MKVKNAAWILLVLGLFLGLVCGESDVEQDTRKLFSTRSKNSRRLSASTTELPTFINSVERFMVAMLYEDSSNCASGSAYMYDSSGKKTEYSWTKPFCTYVVDYMTKSGNTFSSVPYSKYSKSTVTSDMMAMTIDSSTATLEDETKYTTLARYNVYDFINVGTNEATWQVNEEIEAEMVSKASISKTTKYTDKVTVGYSIDEDNKFSASFELDTSTTSTSSSTSSFKSTDASTYSGTVSGNECMRVEVWVENTMVSYTWYVPVYLTGFYFDGSTDRFTTKAEYLIGYDADTNDGSNYAFYIEGEYEETGYTEVIYNNNPYGLTWDDNGVTASCKTAITSTYDSDTPGTFTSRRLRGNPSTPAGREEEPGKKKEAPRSPGILENNDNARRLLSQRDSSRRRRLSTDTDIFTTLNDLPYTDEDYSINRYAVARVRAAKTSLKKDQLCTTGNYKKGTEYYATVYNATSGKSVNVYWDSKKGYDVCEDGESFSGYETTKIYTGVSHYSGDDFHEDVTEEMYSLFQGDTTFAFTEVSFSESTGTREVPFKGINGDTNSTSEVFSATYTYEYSTELEYSTSNNYAYGATIDTSALGFSVSGEFTYSTESTTDDTETTTSTATYGPQVDLTVEAGACFWGSIQAYGVKVTYEFSAVTYLTGLAFDYADGDCCYGDYGYLLDYVDPLTAMYANLTGKITGDLGSYKQIMFSGTSDTTVCSEIEDL